MSLWSALGGLTHCSGVLRDKDDRSIKVREGEALVRPFAKIYCISTSQHTPTEASVFALLGMEWRAPSERDAA